VAGLDIANLVTILALIVASCLISYLTAQHSLKQAGDNAREQLELRLTGLTVAIAELESRVAELTHSTAALSAAATRARMPAAPANGAVAQPPAPLDAEISPEVLIVISAAVTSFLGKKVRIRSAKMLQSPYEIVNPWAQQGRVIVQASHNLQVRRR
jgi:methylmalonyl-CoA carboxyltransferase large subunit